MSELPFVDQAGNLVNSQAGWHRSRNQQRNWETLLQLISLRCQPFDISEPQRDHDRWTFTFEVDTPGVFGNNEDFFALYADCDGVPMITGLCENVNTQLAICVQGQDQNIWFEAINI